MHLHLFWGNLALFGPLGITHQNQLTPVAPGFFSFAPPGMLPEAFPPQPSAYSSLSSLDMDILQHFFTRVTNR